MSISDDLKKKSPEELSLWQAGWKPRSEYDILAEKEWQRRFMLEQHELDKYLLKQQVKWMKFAAFIGFIGILIGAIITGIATLLTTNIQAIKQIETLKPIIQQQTVLPTSAPPLSTISKSSLEAPKKK
jgi:hypothetical protein